MTGEQKPGGLEVAGHVVWWKEGGLSFIQAGEPVSVGKSCRVEPVIFPEPAEARIRELEARAQEDDLKFRRLIDAAGQAEMRATAAEAKLARAVEGFGVITDLSVNLRRGGPDSSDLNDLSDALETAVSVAAEALAALQQGTQDQ